MSENNPLRVNPHDQHQVDLDLDALKFIYQSCVRSILNMDFDHLNDPDSLAQLRTCVTIFETLEKLDPDWLSQNGFSLDKGFCVSWMHWIQHLRT